MKIDGKQIAQDIFEDLKTKVGELHKKNIIPHVAILLIGDDPASKAYVGQKEKKTKEIGAKASIYFLPNETTQDALIELINKLNNDPTIHGIIVQRPLPAHIDSETINQATSPLKDIDAFRKDATFPMPLPAAVLKIIESTYTGPSFEEWLKQQSIVVVGKGETGGGPIITMLKEMGITPQVIDSKTVDPDAVFANADIVISTVGKAGLLKPDRLKKGVLLVGVGMQKGEDGKLHGDYTEEEIKDIASFYTPIPGGVGPVNVAMLLDNLLLATQAMQ